MPHTIAAALATHIGPLLTFVAGASWLSSDNGKNVEDHRSLLFTGRKYFTTGELWQGAIAAQGKLFSPSVKGGFTIAMRALSDPLPARAAKMPHKPPANMPPRRRRKLAQPEGCAAEKFPEAPSTIYSKLASAVRACAASRP